MEKDINVGIKLRNLLPALSLNIFYIAYEISIF